jgi:hypothetical protein
MVAEAFATPTTAQPSPGLAVGEGHFYSDGFRPGDFKYSYGVLEQLLQRNPGWKLADGTVVLQDGTTPPDMRDRFLVGAGSAYALGATGGSANLAAHTHDFTQPTPHAITQPAFGAHAALAAHQHALPFAKTPGGTGNLLLFPPSDYGGAPAGTIESYATPIANVTGGLTRMLSQGVSGGTPDAHTRTTDVALTNNHAGGAVGSVTGTVAELPPYAALYILVKVS